MEIKTNLYITPYEEQNPDRRKELEKCYKNNLQAGFDEVWLVIEEKDRDYTLRLMHTILNESKCNIILKIVGTTRPAFQEYIDIANTYEDDRIHMVCNSDIYIEAIDLNKIKNLNWSSRKLCLALARWDEFKTGRIQLLDRADTADFWAFKCPCDVENAHCALGFPGVDNSVAWKFMNSGYKVVNPSKDIITRHLHNVKGNNYRQNGDGAVIATQICPEPYHFHKSISISEIYENPNNTQFH